MSKRVPIKAAKDLANDYNKEQVIVVTFCPQTGYTVTTYGKTKKLCQDAAKGGKFVMDAIGGNWK